MAKKAATMKAPPTPEEPKSPGVYRVELACPTALAHQSLEVEADSEGDAKAKFCEANGISDSIHQWKIVKVR